MCGGEGRAECVGVRGELSVGMIKMSYLEKT